MKIFIKSILNQVVGVVEISDDENITILDLKKKIIDQVSYFYDWEILQMKMVYRSRVINYDNHTLYDYHILDGDSVRILLQLSCRR